jgi:hypothetical protein
MEIKGHMGSVSFDGQFVRVSKAMRGEQAIPIAAVQGVSIERAGIGMRAIRFAVAGGTLAGPSMAIGSHADLANDPYALTFRKKHEADFRAFADQVLAAKVG